MSRWHRENPEAYEAGHEPWDSIEAEGDALRKERRQRPPEVRELDHDAAQDAEVKREGLAPPRRPREP